MILITGATGFLGSVLADKLLREGAAIRCIRRPQSAIPEKLSNQPIDWRQADLLDYFALDEAFAGVTQVYHCAAAVSFRTSDRALLHQVNGEGTATIVNLCLQHNVRLLHVSSVAAIGDAKPGMLITERDHWQYTNTQSGYAISKYEGEMEVWRGIAEGLDAVIVNPSVIIGKAAGERGSGQLFSTVRKGLRFYTPGSVGIVDVDDVAEVMIRLMETDLSGERFIVSAGSPTFLELFTAIARGLGKRPPGIKIHAWQLSLGWRLAKLKSRFTGGEPALTRETARSAFKYHNYDNSKLLRALPGFAFKAPMQAIAEVCADN